MSVPTVLPDDFEVTSTLALSVTSSAHTVTLISNAFAVFNVSRYL